MKTYLLKINDEQEELINAVVKALQIETQIFSENDEDNALLLAMEEGKKYGRLTEPESETFFDCLGK